MFDCWSAWVEVQWRIMAVFFCVGFVMGGSLGYCVWIITKDGQNNA